MLAQRRCVHGHPHGHGPGHRPSLPKHAVAVKAVRASGPGGQNVNKVATCVEARIALKDCAEWFPAEALLRLEEQQAHRINKAGEIMVVASDERTQQLNRRLALQRLQDMFDAAFVEPKKREQWKGIGEEGKERRKLMKEHRRSVKDSRKISKHDY